MRIAIIGAGLSGLTAGYYVKKGLPNAQVHLFDAAQRVGGVIETEHRDGWLIEHGADCFSINPPDALQLCKDLGIDNDLIEPELPGRLAMISLGDYLEPVPEGFVLMRPTRLWQVFRSPLLSWKGKLRLAAEAFIAKRTDQSDESLASFVRRRLGKETLDRIVQPLVGGIYTADAEKLSMQATMPQFVRMEREYGSLIKAKSGDSDEVKSVERETSGARYGQFRVFPEGMGRLFSEICEQIGDDNISLGTQVTRLVRLGAHWQLTTSDGATENFDGVIVALPSTPTAKLLRDTSESCSQLLNKIEYASSAIVLLGVKTEYIQRLPIAFGFVCPAVDGRRILAASFASHKFPGRTPKGYTLIRVFIGGALQPEMLQQDDQELTQIAIEEMKQLIGLEGTPELTAVQRWNNAMPQYHVGHKQLVAEIEKEVATIDNLEICGNGLHGVGIAPVVGTARRAAERLITALEKNQKT